VALRRKKPLAPKKRRDEFDEKLEREQLAAGTERRERWLRAHPSLAEVPPIATSRERRCTFVLAVETAGEFLGRPEEYDVLMGLSGAAFMLVASADEPCPTVWTRRLREFHLEELGLALELPLREGELVAAAGERRGAEFLRLCGEDVRASLEAGLPILARGGWKTHPPQSWGLVTGWDEDAGLPLGRPPGQVDADEPCPVRSAKPGRRRREEEEEEPYPPMLLMDEYPSLIITLHPEEAERYEGHLVREALLRAVALLRDEAFEAPGAPLRGRKWSSGSSAWVLWEERFIGLIQGERFCAVCGWAEEDCFMGLLDELLISRETAARFLELAAGDVADDNPGAAGLLGEAANVARWISRHEVLGAEALAVREKLREHLGRRALLEAIRDAASLDADLAGKIEEAAGLLPEEPPKRRPGAARRRRRR